MSPLEELYLVLAAIYLADCLHWVRRGARVFVKRWRRYRAHPGGILLGNDRAGMSLAWPLPPLGCFFVTEPLPLRLAPEGVLRDADGACFEWSELRELRADGRRVRAGTRVVCEASSPAAAGLWAARVRELARAEPAARERGLEVQEREALDPDAIPGRLERLRPVRRVLLPFANALFVYCFVLVPLAIEHLGLVPSLVWLCAGLVTLHSVTVASFARAHARFAPAARGERRGLVASIALSPPGAMRAADLFSRDHFADRHPLALASVLLERAEFEREAAVLLRQARHPLPRSPGDRRASAIDRAAGVRWRAALESFLSAQGLDPEALDAPPARVAEDCLCYCPRCQAQFVIEGGTCSGCSGLALERFDARP